MRYVAAIPLRDGAATIAYVVRAALAQSPTPTRVLVCDDGSRDDGPRRAADAGATVLAHARPRGLALARNTLLAAATEEVMIYFDADAVPRPGCAAALLAGLRESRAVAAGGRGVEAADASFADRWRAAHTPQSHGDRPLDDDWMAMGLCCAFRVAALREIGGFDRRFESCGEDVDISLRLRAAGGRIAYRPDAVVDHARSDSTLGVLRQAWRHSRESAAAFRRQGRSPLFLAGLFWRALGPSLGRELVRLDAPAALLTAANLAARLAALPIGALLAP
jgi:GT2 family glycosyltransferase